MTVARTSFSRWLAWLVALAALVGVVRIAGTYGILTQTIDEAPHLSYAMEWTQLGTYEREPHHPPMRAVYTVGPWMLGIRTEPGKPLPHVDGTRMFYEDGQYFRNLGAARAGALPFFVAMCIGVAWFARRLFGFGPAAFAVVLASTLPVLLAHAGLVTNDFLLATTFLFATFAFVGWLQAPSWRRAWVVGAAVGIAVLSKLSALLFVPVVFSALAILSAVFRGGAPAASPPVGLRVRAGQAVAALGVCAFLIWAGYRFSLAPLIGEQMRPHDAIDGSAIGAIPWLRALAYAAIETPVPAPEFLRGILSVRGHAGGGHLSYFMGEVGSRGWPAFFPTAIAVKTPIAFLLLWAVGLFAAIRALRLTRDWRSVVPEVAALAILAVVIPATINIGTRHILLMFPLMAITAGRGAALLWGLLPKWRAGAVAALGLVSWQVASSAAAHPNYLGYFNECCRAHPERILVGSDLDWGQDLQQLSNELRRLGVPRLHLAYSGFADPSRHGLPPFELLKPGQPVKGWVAISEQLIAFGTKDAPYDQYRWVLQHEPVARAGTSIRIYRIE